MARFAGTSFDGGVSIEQKENRLNELEEDYKCLCAILLCLSLTKGEAEAEGNGKKHDNAVK